MAAALAASKKENALLRQKNRECRIVHRTVLKHAAMLEDELKKRIDEITVLSITDALTGTLNWKKTMDSLVLEVEKAKRHPLPLSLIMFDIDGFKAINDKYGHEFGDAVLVKLTAVVQQAIRKIDYFGRLGGDEFLIITPNTMLKTAAQLAARLARDIKSNFYRRGQVVTCSFGVTQYLPGENTKKLLARADAAMYRTKKHGKDGVTADGAGQPGGGRMGGRSGGAA